MNATTTPRIEVYAGAAWAVITDAGIAVYPGSEDAIRAIQNGTVEETAEDAEYYEERGIYAWHFSEELTAEALGIATEES